MTLHGNEFFTHPMWHDVNVLSSTSTVNNGGMKKSTTCTIMT
jgi:hypothetical protein